MAALTLLTVQYDSDCSCRFVRTICRLSAYETSGNQVSRNTDDDCDGVADDCPRRRAVA